MSAVGRQLFQAYPTFRQSIIDMDTVYKTVMGYSLIQETSLFTQSSCTVKPLPQIWSIDLILPSLAMVQMALFDLLVSIGLKPDVVLGHSAGETAMLYACGAASRAMCIEIAIARGQAMATMEDKQGTMAVLGCSPHVADDIIRSLQQSGPIEIACYNSHDAVVIAGHIDCIEESIAQAQSRNIFARKLRTRVPVHSSMMDMCAEVYSQRLRDVFSKYPDEHKPLVQTYCTASGALWDQPIDAEYFWLNARMPVLFSTAVSDILSRMPQSTIFLEISPHPTLSNYIVDLGADESRVLCPMRRIKPELTTQESFTFLETIGRVIVSGCNSVDYRVLSGVSFIDRDIPDFPPYPLSRKGIKYFPDNTPMIRRQFSTRNGPICHLNMRYNHKVYPDLAQHIIKGESIMPGSGYIEMVRSFFDLTCTLSCTCQWLTCLFSR